MDYDGLTGRVTAVNSTGPLSSDYTYKDSTGSRLLESMTYKVNNSVHRQYEYSYRPDNIISSIDEYKNNDSSVNYGHSYTYDRRGQLIEARAHEDSHQHYLYSYDKAGNILAKPTADAKVAGFTANTNSLNQVHAISDMENNAPAIVLGTVSKQAKVQIGDKITWTQDDGTFRLDGVKPQGGKLTVKATSLEKGDENNVMIVKDFDVIRALSTAAFTYDENGNTLTYTKGVSVKKSPFMQQPLPVFLYGV